MQRADVLMINPVRDGLNLVAKEAALVNERDHALILSPEAGVWAELGEWATPVHPLDVAATTDALHEALSQDAGQRRRLAEARRAVVEARTPADWLDDLVGAAG